MQLQNDCQPLYYSVSLGAKRQFLYPVWQRRGGVNISSLFEKDDRAIFTDTKGIISDAAGAKIRKAIDWLVMASEVKKVFVKELKKAVTFKINFITLTLPCMQADVTDVEIKNKALNHFLTICRQKFGLKNYIWKAEAQKNGNIHFHITTDIYIHYGDLRRVWNNCLHSFGYIAKYKENMREVHKNGFHFREELEKHWNREAQHKAFMYGCQTDWQNPNTTDVHSVKKINNLSAYLTKYFTKSDTERRPIKGRLWGMSQNLSTIIKAKIEFAEQHQTQLSVSFLNNKYVKQICDYGVIYKASATDFITHVRGELGSIYQKLYNFIKHPPDTLTLEMVTF